MGCASSPVSEDRARKGRAERSWAIDTYRKIYQILDAREQRTLLLLAPMSVVLGLFEAAGLFLVLPFIALAVEPGTIERFKVLGALYDLSGAESVDSFIVMLGVVVFLVFVCSVIFRAVSDYAVARFAQMRSASLGSRLLKRYLRQPYSWFLGNNSSQLGNAVLSEVEEVVRGSILNAMLLIADAAVAIGIVGLLILVDPVATLAIGALIAGCYLVIFVLTRRLLTTLGKHRRQSNVRRFRIAQDVFNGIKQVKLLHLEEPFLQRFRAAVQDLAQARVRTRLLSNTPRYGLEVLIFGGMIGFVLWTLLSRDAASKQALPILTLYAVAGMRLLPVMQRLYSGVAVMRANEPALDALHGSLTRALGTTEPPAYGSAQATCGPAQATGGSAQATCGPAQVHLRHALVLDDIWYRYPNADRPALAGLSLKIEANTTVGIVGTTGAGKTTAIDVLLGLLTPQKGTIRVDEQVISASNLRGWQRSIGYVPQAFFHLDATFAANIAFGLDPHTINREAVEKAARIAKLHDFIQSLPQGYDTVTGERGARLSGGQSQRLAIARALYREPDILVFDEATSALDNLTERAIVEAIQDIGKQMTVIMVAHRLSTVRHCDKIFFLDAGRLVGSGSYDDLIASNPRFRNLHEAAH